jgi:SAM-dependent methyltransferase
MFSTPGLGNSSSAFGERGITKRLSAVSRQRSLAAERLLDVGCGDGAYTMRLAEECGQVDAVDIEPRRIALFRDRIRHHAVRDRVRIHQMPATELDFPDDTFDRATAIEVVEHIDDLPRALAEIARVLKPGGAFSLTTPNRWFPFETHGVLVRGRRRSPLVAPGVTWIRPLHRRVSDARTFTSSELDALLGEAGLRLRTLDTIMPPFDRNRPLSGVLRRVGDALERTPVRAFGMAFVATADKPTA